MGCKQRPSAEDSEERRMKGARMLLKGVSQAEVARRLDVARQTVHDWKVLLEAEGFDALKAKPRPGRPLKAPRDAIVALPEILTKGAAAFGYQTDLWTAERVCEVFKEQFGVRYNPAHMTRILHQCGLSWQKPSRRASERNEATIKEWTRKVLPLIKKTS